MKIPDLAKNGRRPPIICKDGFGMSVQAGEFYHCSPPIKTETANYTEFEVAFPSTREESLLPYIDDDEDDPTHAIYRCVPLKVIEQIVERHGGLVEPE